MIIAIEGVDASGKASQSKLLAERLKGTRFSFPDYTTPVGKLILGHLKKEWRVESSAETRANRNDDLRNAQVLQSLMSVNRLEVGFKISAAVERGPVIFDRWSASAFVYGKLDGLDVEWLRSIQLPMFEPDVRILLDIPVEESFKRRPERRDRYESDRPFLERVREEYLRLWGASKWDDAIRAAEDWKGSGTTKIEWQLTRAGWWVINGRGSVKEIHSRIAQAIRKQLSATAEVGHLRRPITEIDCEVRHALAEPWAPSAGWGAL